MDSFTRKRIDITFQLGEGQFGISGFNTIKVQGLRVAADIVKAGGSFKGELNLRIYGMDLDTINRLSRVGRVLSSVTNNKIIVEAGDFDIGLANIYQGSIFAGWADFNAQPDVCFTVNAAAGFFQSVQPIAPSSYSGTVDAAVVCANLAQIGGFTFENNGVSVILKNPYFPGTLTDQFTACKQQAGIEGTIDQNILAIWPSNGSRNSIVPIISPATTLVGYPTYNSTGISLRTLFDPRITLGGNIQVQSALTPANGIWRVNLIAHNIESERQGAPWFSTIECSAVDHQVLP